MNDEFGSNSLVLQLGVRFTRAIPNHVLQSFNSNNSSTRLSHTVPLFGKREEYELMNLKLYPVYLCLIGLLAE